MHSLSQEIENNSVCHRGDGCSRGLVTTEGQQLQENLPMPRFEPLKLTVYLWTSLVDRVVGGRNNPIKINPMIKLPEASNSSRVYLNADQRHIVQAAGGSPERWQEQLRRPLVGGSSTVNNSPPTCVCTCAKKQTGSFWGLDVLCF